jgi:hypothetical protein
MPLNKNVGFSEKDDQTFPFLLLLKEKLGTNIVRKQFRTWYSHKLAGTLAGETLQQDHDGTGQDCSP